MSKKPSTADLMQAVAGAIEEALPDGLIFALLVFQDSNPEKSNYISNGNLSDMIIALREGADRLEAVGDHMASDIPTHH